MSLSDTLRRAAAPRLVVGLSRLRWPDRVRTRLLKLTGQRPCIELYFAFDDPYAAIAVPGVLDLAQRHGATVNLYPLLARGIENDPAEHPRRRHAVEDAQRLAQRNGQRLRRSAPLSSQSCAFLAHWTESLRGQPAMLYFAQAALELLWCGSDAAPAEHDFRSLHVRITQAAPALAQARSGKALAANHARLLRRGHWESPAALLGGQWFFAHERLPHLEARLRALME